ncbi:MAG: divalent-cation tolerance protein CutA [Alphaproteobacteria bacterium]|nr:divalent-cation tolerance protein CutA [Alphaproteobacteria bacterium]
MTGLPTTHDDTIIEVRVNCPDEATAAVIADRIVGERLAAAANIHAPISSCYHWKGRIERASEVPLLLKTRRSLFEALATRITELHPYETTGILGVEVTLVNEAYRTWAIDETDG